MKMSPISRLFLEWKEVSSYFSFLIEKDSKTILKGAKKSSKVPDVQIFYEQSSLPYVTPGCVSVMVSTFHATFVLSQRNLSFSVKNKTEISHVD